MAAPEKAKPRPRRRPARKRPRPHYLRPGGYIWHHSYQPYPDCKSVSCGDGTPMAPIKRACSMLDAVTHYQHDGRNCIACFDAPQTCNIQGFLHLAYSVYNVEPAPPPASHMEVVIVCIGFASMASLVLVFYRNFQVLSPDLQTAALLA
ncbi:unnamed protein product [Amoebophrya sp. A120]|nr:unnamed protein product [Amoebophrya sp. A120]|eukprot:GSA120T00006203001.1